MRWLLATVALIVSGCGQPDPSAAEDDSNPPGLESPSSASWLECTDPPIVIEQPLTRGTYHLDLVVAKMGGGHYYPIPSRGPMELLRHVEFNAEWDATPAALPEIELLFDYYVDQTERGIHIFEGGSPLAGAFDMRHDLGHAEPRVFFNAEVDHGGGPGISYALFDQPIRLTIVETYACLDGNR